MSAWTQWAFIIGGPLVALAIAMAAFTWALMEYKARLSAWRAEQELRRKATREWDEALLKQIREIE